ncbi:zinc finger protein RFP-like [Rhineura floridana]|uniref:zinc finger protein RFP-like n=1 Tax=Rhineura floridana TaxID=261503 RepID=UPI002AC82A34|nr:zinc finger protein RFP-like [Rhineura floridana]XP_061475304.1 zinc finger protein RFP-like [Rhineura floridana]XP_061475305.1 zinc finger protein RFP-like [Rhineura floridana]
MASGSLVQEFCDETTCAICLEHFNDPVILVECGHNFCHACLTRYWGESGTKASCPHCRGTVQPKNHSPNWQLANLVGLVKKLKERQRAEGQRETCEKHQEPLKLFCKDDEAPICVVCDRSKEHKNHDVVPAEEAAEKYKEKIKVQLKSLEEKRENLVHQKLKEQQRRQTLLAHIEVEKQKIQTAFEQMHKFLKEKKCALLAQLEDVENEIMESYEENITRLLAAISHLCFQITELEEKCQQPESEFLQDVSSTLNRYMKKGQERKLVELPPELEEKLRSHSQKSSALQKALRKCEGSLNLALNKVNVTLDPETANLRLVVSENQKSVRWEVVPQILPENPERFDAMPCVLGCERFSSGSHWWEVQVDLEVEVEERGWIMWAVGITRESGIRTGRISPNSNEGIWAVGKTSHPFTSCQLSAFTFPEPTPLNLRHELRMIRVSLDYEEGRVEFFDAERDQLIFTFSSASFSGENISPCFWMGWGVRLNTGDLRRTPAPSSILKEDDTL